MNYSYYDVRTWDKVRLHGETVDCVCAVIAFWHLLSSSNYLCCLDAYTKNCADRHQLWFSLTFLKNVSESPVSMLVYVVSSQLTWCFVSSAVEEEGVGAADEREEAEGEEEEDDEEEEEVSSEESSSSEESGAEDEGADDEGPEDEEEEEEEEGAAATAITKEQQEAEEENLGKVC